MNTTRSYTMRARAAGVEKTRRRILDAAYGLSTERLFTDISLEAVARSAGVSVQTVLRQFGSRAGLIEATTAHAMGIVTEERQAPPGDVPQAIRILVDHYELRGDAVVLMLAQESTDPTVAALVETGRAYHRTWVEEVFAPLLATVSDEVRDATLDLLVVATDVYTWKLLRRDRRLDRTAAQARITQLTGAVLAMVPPHRPREH
jgi:AcrR family transcriptional regulator